MTLLLSKKYIVTILHHFSKSALKMKGFKIKIITELLRKINLLNK